MRSASAQRLLQRVRNEDDRHAALLQVAHQVEKVLLLLGRQARRRLVENDHLGLVQHGAGDLDHLLFRRAQRADRHRRRDVEVQRLQKLLCGDIDAAQAVVEAFLAEEQVLRHRHGRHEAVLLEHHGDAEVTRLERRLRRDGNAIDRHRSRRQRHDAGHDLRQRRLAGAILADQRVDLSASQVEIDAVDGRNAGVELGRLGQRKNDVVAHAPNSLSSGAMGSFRTRPGPFAIMMRSPSRSTAATTPWFVPSTRLCSE